MSKIGEIYAPFSQNISQWKEKTVFAALTLQSQNALHFIDAKNTVMQQMMMIITKHLQSQFTKRESRIESASCRE